VWIDCSKVGYYKLGFLSLKYVTISQRVKETGGRSSGFDYIRIILASAVVLWHSFTTAYGISYAHAVLITPYRPIVGLIVPVFFALSGFLVAGSLSRNSVSTFIGLRVLRIFPALAFETLLSAFLVGVLLTTSPLGSYFVSPAFYAYLCNMIGWVHYELPGVFTHNPVASRVNAQLWTVPWELWCYFALTATALLRVTRSSTLFLAMTVAGTVGMFAFELFVGHGRMDQENGVVGPALLMAFLSAVAIYLYRDRLPWSTSWCVASAAVAFILSEIPYGDYLLGFPVAYATIYLGLLNPQRLPLLRGADYSYGLYIYHYVIQQAIVFLLPSYRHWFVIFPLSLLLGGAFAAFSWTFIEKPALELRSRLSIAEGVFGALGRRLQFAPSRP